MKRCLVALILLVALALNLLASFAFAQTMIACEQEYTVTAGDWLSKIAEKFYGDVRTYNAIYVATNLKAKTDSSFATLSSPDAVEVGAKLCIPSKTDAEQLLNSALPTDPTVPANPTSAPAVVTTSGLRLEDVRFNAYGLGTDVQGRVVLASRYDNSSPPGPVGAPAHVVYQFDGEERLWVIPSQAYQAQWNAAGNNTISRAISQLRLLLSDQPAALKPPLPFLPPVPATNDLVARVRYLEFDGGSGIVYLGRWAQDPSPVLASQIYYSFLGLTNDGRYAVSFRYPAQTSALPDEVSELTPEHLAKIEADPQTYLQQTAALLDSLGNSAFGPDLARLDALVFSIHVPSTAATLPPPGGALATPSVPSSGVRATPGAPSNNNAAANLQRLLATDWKWLQTTTPTETITVDAPNKYSIRFNNAGGFGITADCNIGAGNYTVKGSVLTIKDIQSTLIFCGEASLDMKFTAQLLNAASFSFEGGNLVIQLKANGGTMKFGR